MPAATSTRAFFVPLMRCFSFIHAPLIIPIKAVAIAGMPSPDYSAHTIVAHLYDYGFIRFEMGYASSIAVVLFLISYLAGRLFTKVLRED